MSYKLGALAPSRPYGLATLATYAKGKLPTPPASVGVPDVSDWQMLGNDRAGDCTIAGAAHAVFAWDAEVNAGESPITTQDALNEYYSLTGGADTGLVEANVLKTWHRDGLLGHTVGAYAPVEPHDLVGLHQAVAFYGVAYIGVGLPRSAQEQFAAGEAWSVVPGSPVEGGHCVVVVGYDPGAVQIVTWGQVVNVTYPWLAAYLTETWAVVPDEFIRAGHGPALDTDALLADLADL